MRLTRREVLAAGAGMALAPLVGCGKTSVGKPVLRVANWSGAVEENDFNTKIRGLYEQFSKDHACELQIEGIPGSQEYARKMLLNYVAGSQPDVMVLDASSAASFIDNGILGDLTPFIEKDSTFSLDSYFPNVVDVARRGDSLYAIPNGFTPMVMYYNQRLFQEAGVPLPKDGWSFQDFLQTAQALTGENHGFKFASWMPGWIMWLWNNGGDVLSPDGRKAAGFLDSDECVEAVQFIRDLVLKHKVAPSLSQVASMGVDPFANGTAAMEVSGHWSLTMYPNGPVITLEDVGVVSLPTNLPQSQTVMYETGMSMAKNCRHPELAWEFIKFWTSDEVQRTYNSTGIEICGRKDIAAEYGKGPQRGKFLEIVPSARAPWGASVQGYDFVEAEGQKMMDNILKQDADVKISLQQMARRVDAFFAEQ